MQAGPASACEKRGREDQRIFRGLLKNLFTAKGAKDAKETQGKTKTGLRFSPEPFAATPCMTQANHILVFPLRFLCVLCALCGGKVFGSSFVTLCDLW